MTDPKKRAATVGGAPELGHGLRVRHLTMMGLGSAIGAGLFLATGVGIQAAGSGVLLSYLAAAVIVTLVMFALGEIGSAVPSPGAFSTHAALAFGRHAGFVVGWLYWFMLIMVLGAEMTAAAAIMGAWFGVPAWVPALVAMLFFTAVNLTRVQNFGEFEFWFAAVKVAVLVLFLTVGVLLVGGLWPGVDAPGTANFLDGGFLPEGLRGVAAGLLAVAFAFGGIEIVTIAAAESADPARSIATAVRAVILRIAVFYIGAVLVITFLLPRTAIVANADPASSPFTAVLRLVNAPGVVGAMEAVIVIALLSAFNAQMYATARMAYSLARRGDGPRLLTRVARNGIPVVAVLVSIFFGFVAVALNYLEVEGLLPFLLNAVGAVLLVIWAFIAASQLRLRRQLEERGLLHMRMWGHPYTGILALVLIAALTILMSTDDTARQQVLAVLVVSAALFAISLLNAMFDRRRPEDMPQPTLPDGPAAH